MIKGTISPPPYVGSYRLASNKLLHPVVHRIGDIKIAFRVQRHTPGVAELAGRRARPAEDFQRLIVSIKNLNAAVPELADELQPVRVHLHVALP